MGAGTQPLQQLVPPKVPDKAALLPDWVEAREERAKALQEEAASQAPEHDDAADTACELEYA